MANTKLNLAQQLPQLSANIAGAYNIPTALRFAAGNNLQTLNQNLLAAIGNVGQQGFRNRIDFLGALGGRTQQATGLGQVQQQGRLQGTGSNTTTTAPGGDLLSAFAPLASILSGTGGALTSLGALSGVR